MRMRTAAILIGLMGGSVMSPVWVFGQSQNEPPRARPTPIEPAPQSETPPAADTDAEPPEEDDPMQSLDELLGLPGGEDSILDHTTKSDLDRILSGAEIGDAFRQAITMMGDVAKRMSEARDAGLPTQRMQETIVKRLDQLISSLEQQQQQQQQQQQSQQQQQQSQSNQRVPRQQQQQAQQNQEQQGDNTGQTTLPGRRDGDLRPALDTTRAAWGNLPERVREMLVQGTNDRFSSMYDAMTQAYYRKLAEEAKQR